MIPVLVLLNVFFALVAGLAVRSRQAMKADLDHCERRAAADRQALALRIAASAAKSERRIVPGDAILDAEILEEMPR